jgi:hypothetical protein
LALDHRSMAARFRGLPVSRRIWATAA